MEGAVRKSGEELLKLIDSSPTPFHAVAVIEEQLTNSGYEELSEGDSWNLKSGKKYYLKRNDSSLIAIETGSSNPWESGFKIIGAHTDSPLLKIKNEALKLKAGVLTIGVEAYGGGINSTWLDRDLSIAGRVVLKDGESIKNQLVNFETPVAVIPNLAIHLNRDANKGFEYNKQNHLNAILDGGLCRDQEELTLIDIVAGKFNIEKDDILEMDLYLYDVQKGSFVGINEDMISTGRLDNLAMCHSILDSLTVSGLSESTKVAVFFDNEEIGSRTMQGADSNFLSSTLDRVVFSFGGGMEETLRARYHSFLISADGAHAEHPNFSDKHDPSYAPGVNRGPVIKLSANYRYATTSESAGYFINLCRSVDVPYQRLANRSDIPSGSTIGPMSSATLGIKAVDVGNPMFAMHSIRETQGVLDHYYMTKVLTEFYNS